MSKTQNCCCTKRKVCSNIVCDMCKKTPGECYDVCVEPQCGEPELLTVLAPVIYDEIGINLCTTACISKEACPFIEDATCASAEVICINIPHECEHSCVVSQIPCRPKCYSVKLQELSVDFAVTFYDCNKRVLETIAVTNVIFLPCSPHSPHYNEETNPESVTLEIFAPYGVAYYNGYIHKPVVSTIGFSTKDSFINQGLNLSGIAKILDIDFQHFELTIGLSLILQSIYFSQYKFNHEGRAITPKGSINSDDDSVCIDFVEGNLLDKNIKPLELYFPKCDQNKKESKGDGCSDCDFLNHCDDK